MAFRSEKTGCLKGIVLLALAALPALAQGELKYDVRHDHWRKFGTGTLTINDRGVSFQERSKKEKKPEELHRAQWAYQDIEQLFVSPKTIRVLTYEDRKWLLGADREWEFTLATEGTFEGAYRFLKDRLDQRFVAALVDPEVRILWQIPAKLKGRLVGSEGVIEVSADRIVYNTDKRDQSRTWRFSDIENISSSGPFQLTLTTYERAVTHYGNLKGFNFELKQPLDEKRFNILWRRLNQPKGLDFLTTIQEKDLKR